MISYITGFLISLLLTLLTFFTVLLKLLETKMTIIFVILMMIFQIIIQIKFFLNFKLSTNQYWDFISLLFTIFVIFTIFIGTICIMSNLYFMTQNFYVI